MRRMRRTLVALCTLALPLSGCARDADPGRPSQPIEPRYTASSPSPAPPGEGSKGCSLLTAKERRSIAGVGLDVVAPLPATKDSLDCRWVDTMSSPAPTALRVRSTPAQQWVTNVPNLIDGVIASGRSERKYSKRLQAAKKQVLAGVDDISGEEACELFSLLVEVSGGEKGASRLVVFKPDEAGSITATVQVCSRGVYTLLTFDERGLTPSTPLGDAIIRLVKIAHKRAIDIL